MGGEEEEAMGLARGAAKIKSSIQKWDELVKNLVRLASLQTSFVALDVAIKVTNRRVNALDNVVIPRTQNTIKYIQAELDELEREDIFRIKKVLEVKNARQIQEEKEMEERKAAHKAANADKLPPRPPTEEAGDEGGDMLSQYDEDRDLLFKS